MKWNQTLSDSMRITRRLEVHRNFKVCMFTKIVSETIVSVKKFSWCFFFSLDLYVITGCKYFTDLLLSQPEPGLGSKLQCVNKGEESFLLYHPKAPEESDQDLRGWFINIIKSPVLFTWCLPPKSHCRISELQSNCPNYNTAT